MALSFAKISIQGDLIVTEKGYQSFIYDETCWELIKIIKQLNLANLKHVDCVLNTIFNYSQCKEILEKEMPVLLATDLPEKVREAANGLFAALNDITDPFDYLLLEGD